MKFIFFSSVSMNSWSFLAKTFEFIAFFSSFWVFLAKSPDASISLFSCSAEIKYIPFLTFTFLFVTLLKLIFSFFIYRVGKI